MTPGRLRAKLFIFLGVVGVLVAATLASGNQPILGLDLQGGISVVLEPVGKVKPGSLEVAIDVIRSNVDKLGVAEPEINKQGPYVVCDLPGVANRDEARKLCSSVEELRFRPVLALVPPKASGDGESPATSTTTTTTGSTATTAADPSTTTTTVPATASDRAARVAVIQSCDPNQVLLLDEIPTSSRSEDRRDACVVLPIRPTDDNPEPARLLMGPSALIGKDVDRAKKEFNSGQGYIVRLDLTGDGLQKFNELAAQSYPRSPPQNEVAIVLGRVVQSNPAFREPQFDGSVVISGSFSDGDASYLAKRINYGALPVELKELTVQDVSPTLGKDQLRAGIIAGVIGLILVSIYMVVYYRILGLVVIAGIMISAALLLVVITSFVGEALLEFLGGSGRPVLTLAGVTGLIVSIGVTVDSYVVYFERLKDEVRAGRTVRVSADRGFKRSFRTIVAAGLVSFIGAAVLFFVAVGSVKGFAFFLGLSTLLDLIVSYFFMHPIVSLMARKPTLVRMRPFGIGSGLDAPEAVS
jgi:preprotein translocase subunit SecD